MTSRTPQLRPLDAPGIPFGAAWLPGLDTPGVGVDLGAAGYVEEEYLLDGRADTWASTDRAGHPHRVEQAVPYRTRLLVRRPADPVTASGVLHLEPLHPHRDGGLTWRAAASHVLRTGDAWAGVTVYPHQAELLRDRLAPPRYGDLLLPPGGLEWEILADAAEALRAGAVPGLVVDRTIVSGWSATGSFVRVFVREGFAARRPGLVDAAVVFISSGGHGEAGYPRLSPASAPIAADDPRRTIAGVGIPVAEVLSETESETHEHQTRPDSDEAGDRYRLYQVAGTAHIEPWDGEVLTNVAMLEAAGLASPDVRVVEERGDGRLDLVARAVLQRMTEWVRDDSAPPSAGRFSHAGPPLEVGRALARDADGNVLGGVRTPWVEAPLAAYAPHGTSVSEATWGSAGAPVDDPRIGASLTGTMTRFPADVVRARFGDERGYAEAFTAATERLRREGLVLDDDARALLGSIPARWRAATSA